MLGLAILARGCAGRTSRDSAGGSDSGGTGTTAGAAATATGGASTAGGTTPVAGSGGAITGGGRATAGAAAAGAATAGASGAGGCYRDPYLPNLHELPCEQPVAVPDCTDGWCTIEPGCFFMGSPWCEWGRAAATANPIQVTLTHRYRIQQFELTQAEWTVLGVPNPSGVDPGGAADCLEPECPVGFVNWYEALTFANLRSTAEGLPECYVLEGCTGSLGAGLECTAVTTTPASMYECAGYRLPTGPEWEYAARAGTRTSVYSGDIDYPEPAGYQCFEHPALLPIAWYCANADRSSHPVGLKEPNGWGLYDMLGNAFEWTAALAVLQSGGPYVDYGADLLRPNGTDMSHDAPEVRSGIFFAPPEVVLTSRSLATPARTRGPGLGLRLVQTLPTTSPLP